MVEIITPYFLLCGALASTICTLYLAFNNKSISAAVTAGFTVALVVLTNMPNLELLKGWGVEAKIREQVNNAKGLLDQIRDVAGALVVQSYSSLANSILLGFVPAEEILKSRKALDKIAEQAGLDTVIFSEAKSKFQNAMSIRVALVYLILRSAYVSELNTSLNDVTEEEKNSGGMLTYAQTFTFANIEQRFRDDKVLTSIGTEQSVKFKKLSIQAAIDLKVAVATGKVSPLLNAFLGSDEAMRNKIIQDWMKAE